MDEPTQKTTPPRQAPLNTRVILGGAVCAVAAVALMMIGRPSPEEMVAELHGVSVDQVERVDSYAVEASSKESTVVPMPDGSTLRPASTRPVAPSTRSTASETVQKATTIESAPSATPAPQPIAKPSSPAVAESSSIAGTKAAVEDTVTIAGCLERKDDSYVLKNTSGVEVPAGRSWKSGFLKKSTPTVALIDEGSSLRLASHVGQRVETRGILVDREMKARSLRVMGECD